MAHFLTRKRDGQAFPTDKKVARDSGSASYVGVDRSQIESVAVFKEKGKITGGEVEIRKGKELTGKKLNVVSRTQGGVILKTTRPNKISSVAIFKKGKRITGGEVDVKKGKELVGKRLAVTSRLQGGTILKVDSDKDGVPDSKDCEPLNPKKQGKLHDIAVKFLEKREQKLEEKRIEEMRKLEVFKEKLRQQQAVQSVKNAKLQQRQAIINEINQEKRNIEALKKQNKEAKKKIFDASPTGKVIGASNRAIDNTQKFLNKPKTKKVINKIFG